MEKSSENSDEPKNPHGDLNPALSEAEQQILALYDQLEELKLEIHLLQAQNSLPPRESFPIVTCNSI
jgi:hypothetical protein